MNKPLLTLTGSVTLLFVLATGAFSQPKPDVNDEPRASSSPTPVQILYTGKLMGYFRDPDNQPRAGVNQSDIHVCHQSKPSSAATEFLKQRERDENKDAVLVGTGDNFAPQLEARVFSLPPANTTRPYDPGNKELYFSDGSQWYLYRLIHDPQYDLIRKKIEAGWGTIPTDNVGCFLSKARFTAIVPGKHDFYFGADRLRMLARFMASLAPENNTPVQMLGANLTIKTTSLKDSPDQPKQDKSKWPDGFTVSLTEGKTVYPWFSTPVAITLSAPDGVKSLQDEFNNWAPGVPLTKSSLQQFLDAKASADPKTWGVLRDKVKILLRISICPANESNQLLVNNCNHSGWIAEEAEKDQDCEQRGVCTKPVTFNKDNSLTYLVSIKPDPKLLPGKEGHFSTFAPGRNYGFCLPPTTQSPNGVNREDQCIRFSVYTPLFYFPRAVPCDTDRCKSVAEQQAGTDYKDPDPFVLYQKDCKQQDCEKAGCEKKDCGQQAPPSAVIFGVVDPSITEQIGVLNYSWLNPKLNTVVSAEDPAEALNEQVNYFLAWYKANREKQWGPFSGVKILLAQMSAEKARVLAARLKKFQVVVSGADEVQGTNETQFSTTWSDQNPAAAAVAVPLPYFQDDQDKEIEGTVHLGKIIATRSESLMDGKTVVSWALEGAPPKPSDASLATSRIQRTKTKDDKYKYWDAPEFWSAVETKLQECLPDSFIASKAGSDLLKKEEDDLQKHPENWDRVKWDRLKTLTLCAIREKTKADLAFLQKRDFFDRLPWDAGTTPNYLQPILDRIIWKGDLLTLLFVPGSSIKKALDQSKKFNDDDANPISLTDQTNRGLEFLGVRKEGADYIINESPLDEKKIYTVATSDYLGAGDTGYSDFKSSALRPEGRPEQFPKILRPISSIVCRVLSDTPDSYCLPEITRDDYLDSTIAQAPPSYEQPSLAKRFWKALPFKFPDKTEPAKSISEALDRKIQQRSIWTFSLKNLTLSFDSLKNNLSDDDVGKKFGGIKTPGVTATRTETRSVASTIRLSRTSHFGGPFVETGIDYKRQTTGDAKPQVSQISNKATQEAGYIFNLLGGRSQKNLGLSLSLYSETQVQRPFTNFKLASGDIMKIDQDRSWMILPRAGLLWQNRDNSFAAGLQGGRELRALSGYHLVNATGAPIDCLPNANTTISDCIKNNTAITNDTVGSALLRNRPRAGFYWATNLSIPLGDKFKYQLTQRADFFFNFSMDTSADTRYRDESTHSVQFSIFPSLSIGPSVRILLYRNKVARDFLFQKEFGLTTTFTFDLFNRRDKFVQIKHKP